MNVRLTFKGAASRHIDFNNSYYFFYVFTVCPQMYGIFSGHKLLTLTDKFSILFYNFADFWSLTILKLVVGNLIG